MGKFTVDFTGNLGGDAELVTKGNSTHVKFSVGTRHWDYVANREETEFMQCVAFDPKTVAIAKAGHLRKGIKVSVGGKMQIRRNKQTGAIYFNVNVTEVDLMSQSTGNTPSPDADTQGDEAPVAQSDDIPY